MNDDTTPAGDAQPAPAPAPTPAPRKTRAKAVKPLAQAANDAPGTALSLIATAISELTRTEAGLAALEAKHAGVVYDVKTSKGLQDARAARQEIRAPRYAVQNLVEAEVSQLEQAKRQLKAAAEPILLRLEALEKPVDAQVKNREREQEEEKAERERVARETAQRVQKAIDAIRAHVVAAVMEDAAQITARIEALNKVDISLELFEGRAGEAEMARSITLDTLDTMLERAEANEAASQQRRAEAEQLEADRKRLAEEREALKRDQAEWAARHAPPPAPAPAPVLTVVPGGATTVNDTVAQAIEMNDAKEDLQRDVEVVHASRDLQIARMRGRDGLFLLDSALELTEHFTELADDVRRALPAELSGLLSGLHASVDRIRYVYE